jgi:hypothetical protein
MKAEALKWIEEARLLVNRDQRFVINMDHTPQQIQDYAAFFLGDEDNDTNVKRDHRKAFVKKCNGETKSNGEWTLFLTATIFTPRRYEDYIHILGSWSHGGKQVYVKFRRTQGIKHNAYAVVKNFYLKRMNLVRSLAKS